MTTSSTGAGEVLLQTAIVTINCAGGSKSKKVRVLLDGGSELCYVRKSLLKSVESTKLGDREMKLMSFGELSVGAKRYSEVSLVLRSVSGDSSVEVKAVVVDKLCAPVNQKICKSDLTKIKEFRHLKLADSCETPSEEIDVIIGANHLYDVMLDDRIRSSKGTVAESSIFGWILHGPIATASCQTSILHTGVNFCVTEEVLQSFWNCEALGIEDKEFKASPEFLDTMKLPKRESEEGRYQVSWPWIDEISIEMDEAIEVAGERLKSLTKRLKRDTNLLQQYDEVIKDYERQQICEKVDEGEQKETEGRVRYLPHHCVVKNEKATTKVRVVFDAASKDKHGISLNDLMHAGPNLNPELLGVLLRFRMKKIGVTADIRQAFLQISLSEQDQDTTRFLWYDEEVSDQWPKTKPVAYRMKRMPFGVKASPFLLAFTIRHHLRQKEGESDVFELIGNSLYVDDLILSVDSVEAATRVMTSAKEVFEEIGMEMRKWRASDEKLDCQALPEDKVLGLPWNSESDQLRFEVPKTEVNGLQTVTKRQVLHILASIHDPLGLLGPCTVKAKCWLQNLWREGHGWDDELTGAQRVGWIDWIKDMQNLKSVVFDRFVGLKNSNVTELHGFSDASKSAYAAVIYAKSFNEETTECQVKILVSKVKVAPINGTSIPRMELMSCVLLAKLMSYVVRELDSNAQIFCWTDSMVALHWIKSKQQAWKPFVSNRVRTIRDNVHESNWFHVKGKLNPADLPSRGISVPALIDSELWWFGPGFLREETSKALSDESELEQVSNEQRKRIDAEAKKTTLCHVATSTECVIQPERFSDLSKLYRVVAMVLRFCRNCRVKAHDRKLGVLDQEEVRNAQNYLISFEQMQHFSSEIQCVSQNEKVRNSPLSNLNPILEDGLLRVGGRLAASDMDLERKQPIILPKDSSLVKLIVRTEHEKLLHGGVTAIMASLRMRFWIIGLRVLAKRAAKDCVVCRKGASKPFSEDTAPLPIERVSCSPAIPFLHVGVDFAGPLYIEEESGQKKVYILLFTCTRIRAVHLELTMSLSTHEFIAAFDRFSARRGVPMTILSDNAKTFKRAAEILSSKINVNWKFITERAPWHGGFWERLVKSVKVPLRKVLERRIVGLEELHTLLCRIECVINDRPITYVEDSPEVEPLCPSHFLLGRRSQMNELVTPKDRPTGLEDSLASRKNLLTEFWCRWQLEYLPLLNSTFKGSKNVKKIREGDVVLMFMEKGKHLWPLARVRKLHPGLDGKVRTASVECNGKLLRRPIQKLYFLESGVETESCDGRLKMSNTDVETESCDVELERSNTDVETESSGVRIGKRAIHPPQKYGFV